MNYYELDYIDGALSLMLYRGWMCYGLVLHVSEEMSNT